MTVHLLVGPPASGKTRQLLQVVRDLRAEAPLPVWAVLPGRLAVVAFRRRLAQSGGAIGVHVGTFGDLYHEILIRAGTYAPAMPEPMQRLTLRAAVDGMVESRRLSHYAAIADKPGFLDVMAGAIGELKRARVTPDDAGALASQGMPGLGEIAAIYRAYEGQLADMGWIDDEGLNARAAESLESHPDLLKDVQLLVVDGFDSFEPSQIQVVAALGRLLPDVWVTLPGTQVADRAVNRRFARSLALLQEALPQVDLERTDPTTGRPPGLAALEAGLLTPGAPTAPEGPEVAAMEVRSPDEEAREALRWIKAKIVRDGALASDCALVTPDPGRYRPLLKQAAIEFGIPLRFTQGEPLTASPGVAALLDVLALPAQDWPRRLTLEAVRTPYLDLAPWDLSPAAAHQLEAASQYGQVIGGLDQWTEALERLAATDLPAEGAAWDEATPYAAPRGETARQLLDSLMAFAGRLEPKGPRTAGGWVAWLEDLMDETRYPSRQESPADRAAFLRLRETLRAIVLGGRSGTEGAVPYDVFLRELTGILDATTYEVHGDWREPAVSVLRLLEARGLRYAAVGVLGLSEGMLPQIEREDPFLSEGIRESLGLEPRLGREQAGLFYQAVTRADRWLLITRPTLATDGEVWQASPFWDEVCRLLPHSTVTVRSEDPRPLEAAASPEELLFWGVRRGSLPASYLQIGDLGERWDRLQHARDVLAARTAPLGGAVHAHEGSLVEVAEDLAAMFGAGHTWSPSRLESYAACPHQFLVAHVLGLEPLEPPEIGFDAAQLGSMLHEILERVYRETDDAGDVQLVLQTLRSVASEVFDQAPEKYGFRATPWWQVTRDELLDSLSATVQGLDALGGDWSPLVLEGAFGIEGSPALHLRMTSGEARLRGYIDRVDIDQHGQLRIIDYKTGSSHLASRDLLEGRRLQLPLYALAAREALQLGRPVEGLYWKILRAEAGSLKLSSFEEGGEEGPEAAYQVALAHVERVLAGVLSGAFPPVPPRGGCPSYCPAAAWCWRYTGAGWGYG